MIPFQGISPTDCFVESQRYLTMADGFVSNGENSDSASGRAYLDFLLRSAATYAELAKVKLSSADAQSIGLDVDSEEDLRP